jgi:hypothetical protein
MVFRVHDAKRLQLLAHSLIDRTARSVVRGHDERVFGTFGITSGDDCDAFLRIHNLRL